MAGLAMAQMLYVLVFIVGCNVIETSAQYNANSISGNFQPSGLGNQQLIASNFPSTSNTIPSSSATASLPPGLNPNAYTQAVPSSNFQPSGLDNHQLSSSNFLSTSNTIPSSSATVSLPPGLNPNAFTQAVPPTNIQPSGLGNQQLIASNFPSTSNTILSATPQSSSATTLLPPGLHPNAFTKAVLAIPSLQRFLNIQIPRFQGADLLFRAAKYDLIIIGHPAPATVANVVAQNMAGLDFFTIPLYLYGEGKLIEQFLISKGIKITPDLPQSYADFMEKALESYSLDSNEIVLRGVIIGFMNFIESLGFRFVEQAYILALMFSEDVIATIDTLKP